MALVKFKTLAVVWNGIFSRWADVGNILLWHASFSFFFIKRWSSCFNSLLPPFNDICWPLIRASCYMSLGPPGHSYLVINLHVPNFRFMYMTICFFYQMSEGRLEQECLAFGEDDILSSGFICVPTSLFMIGLEIMEVASTWPWSLSSVLRVERY